MGIMRKFERGEIGSDASNSRKRKLDELKKTRPTCSASIFKELTKELEEREKEELLRQVFLKEQPISFIRKEAVLLKQLKQVQKAMMSATGLSHWSQVTTK